VCIYCTSVESSLNSALMPSMNIVRPAQYPIVHSVSNPALFSPPFPMCYVLLPSLPQEKAAEHAADSRRQFNMLPVGFKGFREAQEGTGKLLRCGLLLCVVGLMVVCVWLWCGLTGRLVVQGDSSQSACCSLCRVG
jgi:hypothetical protein